MPLKETLIVKQNYEYIGEVYFKNCDENIKDGNNGCSCVGYLRISDAMRTNPKAGLLNKNSRLAPALAVTNFTIATDMILVTLCCPT